MQLRPEYSASLT